VSPPEKIENRATMPKGVVMSKTKLNSDMIDALSICQALDDSAQMLTLSDGSNWAAWVRYFLEALEHKASNSGIYEAFLESLGDELSARLEQGQW
jgi:hypothetical protein